MGDRRGRERRRIARVLMVLVSLAAVLIVPSAAGTFATPALADGAPLALAADGYTWDPRTSLTPINNDYGYTPYLAFTTGPAIPGVGKVGWAISCSNNFIVPYGPNVAMTPGEHIVAGLPTGWQGCTTVIGFAVIIGDGGGGNQQIVLEFGQTDPAVFDWYANLQTGPQLHSVGVGGSNTATIQKPCSATKRPVVCSSGDFWHTFSDIAVPGRTADLQVSRTYNSLQAATPGPFGFGWSCSFCVALAFDGSGNATISQDNGSQVTLNANGSGGFAAAAGTFATLVHNGDGTYTYTMRGRRVFTFNASGQLTATSDLDGNTTTYSYTGGKITAVTDGAGRTIAIGYGTNGLISQAQDPLGRITTYGYDTAGDLTSSTDPATHVTQYSYDSNHLMLTMTDPNGGVTTDTFDSIGRVLTQTDPLGRLTAFSYLGNNFSSSGGETAITNPAGDITLENYVNGDLTSLTKGYGTAAAATWTYAIDPTTLGTSSVTDPNGHTSSQTFDAAGNTTSVTDADGRTTHATFDGLNDPLTRTDAAGVSTTFTYTATGDVLTSSTPLGTGAVTTSNTYGNSAHPGDVTSSTDPNGHATTFGYDAYGDVSTVTDADGNKSTSTFDADGERLTSVAPDGNVAGCGCAAAYTTTNAYFANGQLHTSTDPLGGVTTYGYDGNGNTTSMQDPTLLTTTSSFDADNELTKVTQPDGTYVSYGYDGDGRRTSVANGTQPPTVTTDDVLGDVLTVTDPVGNQTVNTYDLGGRLTSSKSANNGTTSFTYFNAGQLKTSTSPTGGVTSRTYDSAGRLATVTDPDSNVTSYAYDALGRQTTTTRADTTTTVNAYDPDGNLTSYTDGASRVTSYVYSPAGRETSSTDPDLRVTRFGYDATGHQTTLTDALNRVTTNTFDAGGRLTKTVYTGSSTPQVTYTYDAAGRRKTMVDGTGTTTTVYDAFGRVANVTDGGGSVVRYTYDTLGRIATLTYPDGHVVTRGYDAADRYTSLTDWNAKTTTFGYDADSNQTTTSYPNGVVDTTTLNAADQPTAITVKNGATSWASFGYTPDPAGQLSTSTDSLAPTLSTSYTYTKLNQVARPANATTTYSYDASGNLTGLTNGTTQTFDAAGQLIQATVPGVPAPQTFNFNAVGDRTGTVAPATTDGGNEVQMLTNTGFESALSHTNTGVSGTPLGESGYYGAPFSTDTTTFHSGIQSMKVVTNSATNPQGFMQMPHTLAAVVPANTTVYGSFWMNATAGKVFVCGGQSLKPDGSVSFGGNEGNVNVTATGSWQQVTVNPFTLAQDAVIGLQCHLATAASGVTLWVDDTSVLANTGPNMQVLTNTGFESPIANAGGLGEFGYFSAPISNDATVAHTGATSLKVVTNSSVNVQGFYQFPHTLTAVVPANTTMQGSLWVKAPAGTGLYAGGRALTATGAYIGEGQGHVNVTATGSWQQINLLPFTMTQPAVLGIEVRLAVAASGVTFWADDTSMLATTTASYDQNSQLTAYNSRTTAATYTYNGDGVRTSANTNGATSNFSWDTQPGLPLLLADATNDYIYGPGSTVVEQINKSTGTANYLHTDRIGSIRLVTDATGNTAATTSYDPYGNVIARTGATTAFGYSGQYTDPTGLLYLRARYYDPTTGQFLTVDPAVDSTRSPYGYAAGDPLDNTDPTGMFCIGDICTHFDPGAAANAIVNIGRGASFGLTDKIANAISPGASCTVAQNKVDQFLGAAAINVVGASALTGLARMAALRLPYTAVRGLQALGVTDALGNISVDSNLVGQELRQTLLHEAVHSIYTRIAGSAISQATYGTVVGKVAEEWLAETFATGRPIAALRFALGYL